MDSNAIIAGAGNITHSTVKIVSDASLAVPNFFKISPDSFWILAVGFIVCIIGMIFGLYEYNKVKNMKSHRSMLKIGDVIFETCKTYLLQQGKLLIILELFIGVCIVYYFGFLKNETALNVVIILFFSIVGILGSYIVAWFGIRMNTHANSRTAFVALEGKPIKVLNIPLKAGMSIGVLLVSIELFIMLVILIILPYLGLGSLAGYCFIGFAIGESLGASALRVAGGIFTKIADIGADLMKIVFKIKEDDPRNPGVIADCTGDNAGDSVGPTADGFETYGVTGVAIITFILLGVLNTSQLPNGVTQATVQIALLTWIFVLRYVMLVVSILSYWINGAISNVLFAKKEKMNFEHPLTSLIWITSILSIIMTFIISYWLLPVNIFGTHLWLILAVIISCGTLGGALIPEVTKRFTSPNAIHVEETVTASREGGASLNILSGLVAGNFSAFWIGAVIIVLMLIAYCTSVMGLELYMLYPSILAFGLVAFGLLGMGPVTIAVDSYGPVTDNAQSIYELSLIEEEKHIAEEIKREFGFKPHFTRAKDLLEENDGAGNTFKATAKPVLIATAVIGSTTMIFSLILLLRDTLGIAPEKVLNLLDPFTIIGFLCGGAVIFWFTGASIQAVVAGAYKAVAYIKDNIDLDMHGKKKANIETSKEVVKICTTYAQRGMLNIFIAVFCFALAFAFFSAPVYTAESVSLFISYLIAIAVFGLFQAIFMANAGGCWDNAKKIVEVNLKEKNTDLHEATIVGDTVGDPFKDTSSVAMNPIIKFTTLFGVLAMEIALDKRFQHYAILLGCIFLAIALIFVWRSFYGMRIEKVAPKKKKHKKKKKEKKKEK
jgi:K(+)-stimulated pyrophosphate-energized sodium pump